MKSNLALNQLSLLAATLFACLSCFPAAADGEKFSNPLQIKPYKSIDLTHVLGPGLPNYDSGEEVYRYKTLFTIEKEGYSCGEFTTLEHYGTHVDAPSHFCKGAATIDQVKVEDLVVPCLVIDVRAEVQANPDYALSVEKILSFEKGGAIPEHTAVLLLTGWADRWERPNDYRNADNKGIMHFPGFGKEAVDLLVNKRHVASLGIDTLSIDVGPSQDFPVHKLALGRGLYMMENLQALDSLPARGSLLFCGPLPLKGGTGSPARIVAIVAE